MSRASLIKGPDFEWTLTQMTERYPEIVDASLKAGAAVLAAQMKENLRGEIADKQARELVGSFGITPLGQDRSRNWNVHLGFDGYQKPGTGKWASTGIPFQMIARVFESGSVKDGYQWRRPTHFSRRAVQAKRDQAKEAMRQAAEAVLQRMASGGKG